MYTFASIASAAMMCISSHTLNAPMKYNVLINGAKVGSAVVNLTGTDATGYVEDAVVDLKKDGHSFWQHQTDHFGKNGASTSTSTTFKIDGHTAVVTATFSRTGAAVQIVADGKPAPKQTVPMLPSLPHLDVSHLWFSHVRPAVGDSLSFQSFSSQDAHWHKQSAKYVGKKPVQLGAKRYTGNQVDEKGDDGSSTMYLDDQGNLIKGIQPGNISIELVSG